ncbi:CgeB family protein [Cytobacillus sp. NCCP-133]|uniref:CgeB family protein n=1 Tax=Cytobacillus sp. NCCP-133 TaxID=766848 RepID=UPI0022308047|nr:glycosyltransferase [Cytobacillus sp. NCCP-133]GLB62019.1 protein CgeB [Cytobacillus sp. NCCP-133]
MNILFVTSGYTGIYKFFEDWIVQELNKKHNVKLFNPLSGLARVQSLTNNFKAEAALVLLGFKTSPKIVEWLKTKGVKTAVWFTEDPYYMDRTEVLVPLYDYLFTIDSAAKNYYIGKGHKQTFHLPLAAAPSIFKPIEVPPKFKSDICLLGYPYPDRIKYVQLLLHNTPYHIKVIGNWRNKLFRFRNNPRLTIHDDWVPPSSAAQYYNGAKIVLNTHRPHNLMQNKNRIGLHGTSINNRTFDVAACGVFQLIEYKEDLPIHFVEDHEIVSFNNEDELIFKINYYMKFKDERKKIAANAAKRVLKDHTFEKRIEKMLSIIQT